MKNCTGCGACENICPKGAISYGNSERGFLRPEIDTKKCIKCGLCEKVCPHEAVSHGKKAISCTYLFCSYDVEKYKNSSSGGAVAELYEQFFKEGVNCVGVKYYGNPIKPVYCVASSIEDINAFSGSKYVEASSEGVFEQVATLLRDNKSVFFVGTPCAVSALYNYLYYSKTDSRNLYTCEFVCNGVGSPRVFTDYIEYIQKKNRKKVLNFRFRVKETLDGILAKNNTTHHSHIVFEDGKIIEDTDLGHAYQNLYFKQLISNPICHSCKYTTMERVADITVGDSIGFKSEDGDRKWSFSSLIMVNSQMGEKLVEVLRRRGNIQPVELSQVKQPHLSRPSEPNPKRELFWKVYKKMGFGVSVRLFGGMNFISRMKKKVGGIRE